MNKKNMFLAGLMFAVATTALPIGEQHREIVYTLHALEQDFTQEPFIQQNIDMFIELFEMNIKLNEKQVQSAGSMVKKSLAKTTAAIGGIAGVLFCVPEGLSLMRSMIFGSRYNTPEVIFSMQKCLEVFTAYACTIATTYVALNVYDAFKTKNTLNEALALDKEILTKLIEFKESVAFGSDSAENLLSETATKS